VILDWVSMKVLLPSLKNWSNIEIINPSNSLHYHHTGRNFSEASTYSFSIFSMSPINRKQNNNKGNIHQLIILETS
jgi:hypothetical protein